jgi:hypothetical protein
MLAQNFMTAEALGIPEAECTALIKVLGMMERGEITAETFDMKEWDSDCGTVHCIGGWAQKIGGKSKVFDDTAPWGRTRLSELFYPGVYGGFDGYRSSVSQGAAALRNYLTLGKPCWAEVLKAY